MTSRAAALPSGTVARGRSRSAAVAKVRGRVRTLLRDVKEPVETAPPATKRARTPEKRTRRLRRPMSGGID